MPQSPDKLGLNDLLAQHSHFVGHFGQFLQLFLFNVLSEEPLHHRLCIDGRFFGGSFLGRGFFFFGSSFLVSRSLRVQGELGAAEKQNTEDRFHDGQTVPIFVTKVEQKVTILGWNERCLPQGATPESLHP